MESFISDLDCARFGCKIAKVNSWLDMDIPHTIKKFRDYDVKLVITKVNSDQLNIINTLESLGFRIKDTQVTYKYDMSKLDFNTLKLHPDLTIREFIATDIDELVLICKESFVGYGHYFADDRLDKERCSEIYPDWVRRSCLDKLFADQILVAEINGQVAGFLSFKILESPNGKYAAGGMGAVAKNYRKYGIFNALAKSGLLWGANIGLLWEEHNVLTTNYAVNRVFSSAGFGIMNSFMTLHGWLD